MPGRGLACPTRLRDRGALARGRVGGARRRKHLDPDLWRGDGDLRGLHEAPALAHTFARPRLRTGSTRQLRSALILAMNRAFLGVEQSATGRAWRDRLDERGSARALAITQRHQLPELLARILAGR